MNSLPCAEGEFDLVWSEGAVYILGFDTGLAAWGRFLKPGGSQSEALDQRFGCQTAHGRDSRAAR